MFKNGYAEYLPNILKKIPFLSAVICGFILLAPCDFFTGSVVIRVYGEEKLNLAVAEFEARNVSAMESGAISDFVRTELVKLGYFNVLERKSMEHLLTEQKFQMSGCTTQECAVRMGRLLNCQKVIIGTLTNLGGVWYITGNVVDVESGKIDFSERVQTTETVELARKSDEIARILTSKIRQVPTVQSVEEKKRPVEPIQKEVITPPTKVSPTQTDERMIVVKDGTFYQAGKEFDSGFFYDNLENRVRSSQKAIEILDEGKSAGKLGLATLVVGAGAATYFFVGAKKPLWGGVVFGVTALIQIPLQLYYDDCALKSIKVYNESLK